MEDCIFALQFLVDSNNIFEISSEIFTKTKDTIEKEMELKPTNRNPCDVYDFVFNLFTGIIIEKLNILNNLIKDDIRVMQYVKFAILKLLTNMKHINRIKMERMITIIKIGINPNCKFKTIEALSELEYYVDILYPNNRKFFSENEKFDFLCQMSQIIRRGNEPMINLLEKIDLTKSFTDPVKNIIKKCTDSKEVIKIITSFIQKIPLIETPMDSINIISSIINCNLLINIEFSQICISTILINGELYIYYYGQLNEKIAGCFSLDFQKLKNIIDDDFTHYIFYFVLCCYCLNKKDNIFSINLDIDKTEVNSMFIFLESKYISLFREKCKEIDNNMIYSKIIKHLVKFLKISIPQTNLVPSDFVELGQLN